MPEEIEYVRPERCIYPRVDGEGKLVFTTTLTHCSRTDPVGLINGIVKMLPIVFVPGTMGSNLKVKGSSRQVWRFDSTLGIARQQVAKTAGDRQKVLHPDRTEVDSGGAVPTKLGIMTEPAHFWQRGWGEVIAGSYSGFLIWLEENFHGQRGEGIGDSQHKKLNDRLRGVTDGLRWRNRSYQPLTEEECVKSESWNYPVHAFGYNWLQSNEISAGQLAERIKRIIASCNSEYGRCNQVIVITHSMGGLVARRCAQLPGMSELIAGVVHGVMPAVGAAVAYRRCKVGMWDEDWKTSLVIGHNGQEVTAVFAQSPGALELLPVDGYRNDWLEFNFAGDKPRVAVDISGDYHQVVYRTRHNWWGLIKEEWLKPDKGESIIWEDYLEAMNSANSFQTKIKKSYHANSWAFYGVGVPSFETITWKREESAVRYSDVPGDSPTNQEIFNATGVDPIKDRNGVLHHMPNQVFQPGSNPAIVYGPSVLRTSVGEKTPEFKPVIYCYLRAMPAKEDGDGTVPAISGRAPEPFVKQLFAVPGLEHEPAYKSSEARDITAYVIARIAALATSDFGEINGASSK